MSPDMQAAARTPAAIRAEFPGTRERVYLNTAAEGCGSRTLETALARYATAKQSGSEGRAELYATEAACKQRLAAWLGCAATDLALLGSTTEAINTVLFGLDWQPGDNVVITELEFPSAMVGCLRLSRERGVEVRVVPHGGGVVSPEAIAAQLDHRTRLVVLSHVSYLSGARTDLAAVGKVAHERGALLLVDASQSLGAVPVPLAGVDFLVACAFKWLVASHGVAMLYCRPDRIEALPAQPVGWRGVTDFLGVMPAQAYTLHPDARRFEVGMSSYPAIYALHDALGYLELLGAGWIAERVLALSARVLDVCEAAGFAPLTPRAEEARAGIVAVQSPRAAEIGDLLAAAGIVAWCRDGRVRLATHFYNTEDDVDALAAALATIPPA